MDFMLIYTIVSLSCSVQYLTSDTFARLIFANTSESLLITTEILQFLDFAKFQAQISKEREMKLFYHCKAQKFTFYVNKT